MSLINKLDSSAIEFAHSLHNNFNFLDYFFSVITNMGDAIFLIAVIIGFLMIIIGCCFKIAKCELAFGITLLIGSIFIIIFLHKSLSDTRDLSVLIQNSKEYSTTIYFI